MQARRVKPQAQKCGQSYLCDRKNKPWVTSPNTEKANRKLTADNSAKPLRRRDPTSHSALVKQQVQLYVYKDGAKTVEMRK